MTNKSFVLFSSRYLVVQQIHRYQCQRLNNKVLLQKIQIDEKNFQKIEIVRPVKIKYPCKTQVYDKFSMKNMQLIIFLLVNSQQQQQQNIHSPSLRSSPIQTQQGMFIFQDNSQVNFPISY